MGIKNLLNSTKKNKNIYGGSVKKCPPYKILNPKTDRCVSRSGQTGKKILKSMGIQNINQGKKVNKGKKVCPPDKILNPKTDRCVSRSGQTGKKILRTQNLKKKSVKKNKLAENSKKKLIKKPSKKPQLKQMDLSDTQLKSIKFDKNDVIDHLRDASKTKSCDLFKEPRTRLKFLGAGIQNKVYLGCITDECLHKVAIRLMSRDYDYLYNNTHPNFVEMRLYDKFNKMLDDNLTHNLTYRINNFSCKVQNIADENQPHTRIREYKPQYNKGEIYEDIDILINELCIHGSVNSFIKKHIGTLRTIDYQIMVFHFLSGLVTCQYHIPEFRHNDIHHENILVGTYNFKDKNYSKEKDGSRKYVKYLLFDKEYYLPYTNYCVKLYDFDMSVCKELPNAKVEESYLLRTGVSSIVNPVFDCHLGINSLFHMIYNKVPSEVRDFYFDEIPSIYRGFDGNFLAYARLTNYKNTHDINNINLMPKNIRTPSDILLKSEFLDVFRQKPQGKFKIVGIIDSKIPNETQLTNRKDMFK